MDLSNVVRNCFSMYFMRGAGEKQDCYRDRCVATGIRAIVN